MILLDKKDKQAKTISMIITIVIIVGIAYFIFSVGKDYYKNYNYKNDKVKEASEVIKETNIEINSAAVVESMARIKIFNKCAGYLPFKFYKDAEVKISDLTNEDIVAMLYFSKNDACGEVLNITQSDASKQLIMMFGRDDFTLLEANKNFSVTIDENKNYVITPNNCEVCSGDANESSISKASLANNSLFIYETYNNKQYKWKLNKGRDGRYYFVSISKI